MMTGSWSVDLILRAFWETAQHLPLPVDLIFLCVVFIINHWSSMLFCFRTPFNGLPTVTGQRIDLYLLYSLVVKHGGFHHVSKLCDVICRWGQLWCSLKTVFAPLDHWHLVLSGFGFFTLVSVEILYHKAHYLVTGLISLIIKTAVCVFWTPQKRWKWTFFCVTKFAARDISFSSCNQVSNSVSGSYCWWQNYEKIKPTPS